MSKGQGKFGWVSLVKNLTVEALAVELSFVQSNWKLEGVFYTYEQRLVLKRNKASIYYCLSLDVRHLISSSKYQTQ